MKITLKRVILCGAMLLGAIFFLLVLAFPFKHGYGANSAMTYSTNSLLDCMSGKKPFADGIAWIYTTTTSNPTVNGLKSTVDGNSILLQVFAVIGLILVIADFLAIIGGFFLKTNGGARKLIIPFMAITIVFNVVLLYVVLFLTNSKFHGVQVAQADIGPLFIFYFLGIIFFVGALIASGVTPEKVLVGKKD